MIKKLKFFINSLNKCSTTLLSLTKIWDGAKPFYRGRGLGGLGSCLSPATRILIGPKIPKYWLDVLNLLYQVAPLMSSTEKVVFFSSSSRSTSWTRLRTSARCHTASSRGTSWAAGDWPPSTSSSFRSTCRWPCTCVPKRREISGSQVRIFGGKMCFLNPNCA